jgi:hypothetical protein
MSKPSKIKDAAFLASLFTQPAEADAGTSFNGVGAMPHNMLRPHARAQGECSPTWARPADITIRFGHKSEIRNPKLETNPKHQGTND